MIETDEIDDDFFTPVAGTSLANIFGNVSKQKDCTENDSLKYVPPKPQNVVPIQKEQTKSTECVFACAVTGHEWYNNVYNARGKVGFAIVKIQKTGEHNIIIYDSNKVTLSSTPISTKLEVSIKNESYISYYDSINKYWSLYYSEGEIQKITDLLKTYGASINYSTYIDKGPPEPTTVTTTNLALKNDTQKFTESDTDSTANRKTKASILNRMATMGHSVLPIRALPSGSSSDASITSETDMQPKSVRHKPIKTCTKKNNVENISSEHQHFTETHQKIIATPTESQNTVTMYSNQLLPLTNTSIVASTSNDMGLFVTEQRIANSELRININRITDKVDSVIDKINTLDFKGTNTNTDILMKLLTEYENKIKIYEELLKAKEIDQKKIMEDALKCENKAEQIERFKNKISILEKENVNKDIEISKLQKEITLNQEYQTTKEKELLTKINSLESNLQMKNKEISDLTVTQSTKIINSNNNIEEKVKNIMNNTFQTISMNFESNEVYTGDTIKKNIGTVIKKITIQTLREL